MTKSKPLVFELIVPAIEQLMPALEVSIAGVLCDFGYDCAGGEACAAEIVKGLQTTLKKCGFDNSARVHCNISLSSGKSSRIELFCDPPCNLHGLYGMLSRSECVEEWIQSAELCGSQTTLTLCFGPPE